jgi:hypothetical protein
MLDLPRYLLGAAEILWLAGFVTLGASALRVRLLPAFSGAPAHLATAVLGLALLIWVAEILGSLRLFEPWPYLLGVALAGLAIWTLLPRVASGWGVLRPPGGCGGQDFGPAGATSLRPEQRAGPEGQPTPATGPAGRGVNVATLIALAIAAIAIVKFGAEVKPKLSTGMSGFDSTWYHGPFAAGFFQSGDTWELHYIAPQFLAWFYPANAEIFHAAGTLAFDRDLLSPLLNLGWFVGCLVACWCIGRPYGVAPWSLSLGAIALSLPVLSDQAGEARNDIVGIFFLLAAVAIAINARQAADPATPPRVRTSGRIPAESANAVALVGLAAGLAAGTKLNFLLPAAVLVLGLAVIAPTGCRWRAFGHGALAALAGGGYWYLRNLVHSGNPLPWFDSLGPVSLPAPDQALGGREGRSVLGYLVDGAVWSDWLLPGLRDGLTILWPLLALLAAAGLVLCIWPARSRLGLSKGDSKPNGSSDASRVLAVAGLTGLAAALAWLVAPTSASGPDGMPRGFESGLRYLAPALVLGLALLPAGLTTRMRGTGMGRPPNGRILKAPASLGRRLSGRGMPHTRPLVLTLTLLLLAAVAIGYPIQRHYLENRYADPTFAAPGLNAAFEWSRSTSGARIATTSTRQYPLYGTDLSNHVQFVGEEQPHGGFTAPTTCPQWRRLLNAGDYDYAITTRDRIERGKPPYPATAKWTAGSNATVILRKPPTVVFRLKGPLDPSVCPELGREGRAGD